MADVKYKLTNTTVKPKPKSGPDTRKAIDKVGYGVKFYDGDKEVVLQAGRSYLLHNQLTPGILNHQNAGFLRVDKVEDVTEVLKEHTLAETTPRSQTKPTTTDKAAAKNVAKAVEMGAPVQQQKGGKEYEGAVNPDGDPNFLVKVKSEQTLKKEKDAAGQPNNSASK